MRLPFLPLRFLLLVELCTGAEILERRDDLVAVSTTVNCRRLHDQMASVRMGSTACLPIVSSCVIVKRHNYEMTNFSRGLCLESVEELDDVGCRADVHEQQLRKLVPGQVALWQHPSAQDQNQHQELLDQRQPRIRRYVERRNLHVWLNQNNIFHFWCRTNNFTIFRTPNSWSSCCSPSDVVAFCTASSLE